MYISKYNEQPGIDTYWDNSYRFNLKWDASDAMKNRTERFHRTLTKDFDTNYSNNRARLAADYYQRQLAQSGVNVNLRDLREKLEQLMWPYESKSWDISLDKLRNETVISKGNNGLYKYELPKSLMEEYKRVYYRLLTEFYDDIYQYIKNNYVR